MSIYVEFQLSGSPIAVTDVAAAHPDVTFELERWRTSEDLLYWYVWAEGGDLEGVTSTFEDVSTVRDVNVISDAPRLRLYRLTIDPSVAPPSDELLRDGTITTSYIEPDCLRIAATCSCRDVLTGTFDYLRSNDLDVSVEKLRTRPPDAEESGLTEKQLEALVTAHEMGYFDESTCVTQTEVAEELGICRSAVSQRLRRAERELVERHLGNAR